MKFGTPGLKEVKCLVFDWDGTLVDSTATIVNCMQAAIRANELPERPPEAIRDSIGLGLLEAVKYLYPDVAGIDPETLAESYRMHYRKQYRGKTRLFPLVKEMLAELNKRGFLLAVATGKSRRGLESSFDETETRHFFHMSRCADESISKPHPQMLHDIMLSLAVTADATLVIGDSRHDLQMAKSAGCESVAVTYGSQSRQRLLEYDPLVCLDAPDELIPWLETQQIMRRGI